MVDSNVLLDMVSDDPIWSRWSIAQLEAATLRGPLLINDVIYAEVSARYRAIEDLEHMLAVAGIALEPMPRCPVPGGKGVPALSVAGWIAHRRAARLLYRGPRRGGAASSAHTR